MRAFRLILFLGLGLFILYTKYETGNPASYSGTTATTPSAAQSNDSVPAKVLQVLEIVRKTGDAPEGYVGGRVFQNREGHLPAEGDYREFDVDPKPASGGRNAERIIVEWNSKKAWYTADHYQTFTPLP